MERQLKYAQLTRDLQQKILSGEIKAGDKLPSENELSVQYGVSRQTVRKALETMHEAGYIYAEHGRGTFCSERMRHTRTSKNIAVITTYLSDYIFPRVIQGIDQVMTEHGYSILLKNTKNSRQQEAKCLEELLQKDIDGLIIEPSKSHIFCRHRNLYQLLDDYRIPYVFIQGSYAQMADKPHILLNDKKGGYLVTRYLISKGYRRIVGIFKSDDSQGQDRHKGYVQALQEAGIAYDPDRVIWFYTEDRAVHPYEQIRQMAKQGSMTGAGGAAQVGGMTGTGGMTEAGDADSRLLTFDAVVAYNDQIACEVIRALQEQGLRVPEDVAVTGYDNSYLAQSGKIPLTTITHPQEKLGEMAAELLLRLMREDAVPEQEGRIVIEPELIVRESTGEGERSGSATKTYNLSRQQYKC